MYLSIDKRENFVTKGTIGKMAELCLHPAKLNLQHFCVYNFGEIYLIALKYAMLVSVFSAVLVNHSNYATSIKLP